jgi:hypothetical protein
MYPEVPPVGAGTYKIFFYIELPNPGLKDSWAYMCQTFHHPGFIYAWRVSFMFNIYVHVYAG